MSNHEGIWSEYRPTYWDGWSAVKRRGDLVRCMDCKRSIESSAWPGAMECWYIDRGVEPDGFCAWGERKEVRA